MARNPRYSELAAQLRKSIASGAFKVGAQLPTELALCKAHGVSRHTARAALAVLEDARLIERRPGLGTRVIAAAQSPAFTQPLGGLAELLQYARNARLHLASIETTTLRGAEARRLGAPAGSRWLRLDGVRRAKAHTVAATTIFVANAVGAQAGDFKGQRRAVTEQIERRYGVAVAAIRQTIRAETIVTADAEALGADEGSPILRTIRRYFDASDRLFVVSDTRHPADRFAYEMNFRRDASVI